MKSKWSIADRLLFNWINVQEVKEKSLPHLSRLYLTFKLFLQLFHIFPINME